MKDSLRGMRFSKHVLNGRSCRVDAGRRKAEPAPAQVATRRRSHDARQATHAQVAAGPAGSGTSRSACHRPFPPVGVFG